MTPSLLLQTSAAIGIALTLVAMLLAALRLWRGPTATDRIVALDMLTVSIVVICPMLALQTGQPAFIDAALVLAIAGFVTVVALARMRERMRGGKADG